MPLVFDVAYDGVQVLMVAVVVVMVDEDSNLVLKITGQEVVFQKDAFCRATIPLDLQRVYGGFVAQQHWLVNDVDLISPRRVDISVHARHFP